MTDLTNHWELYTMKGWRTVSDALDKAFAEAILLAPEKPARERALLAREHVRKEFDKYWDFGAGDTEPDAHLVWMLNRHFNTDISRWD